ncbi:SLC13 family permease [Actinomadura viridis]|uniref:Anion transporter n=1 Tax=Actinomadura viridis TaxID=58110 RepID=A0A931GGN4_9ACTN|nr:SLC13 family permease [Actinomadura viridis]MBG6086525.1 anion transporter [Actinomadura viridis]
MVRTTTVTAAERGDPPRHESTGESASRAKGEGTAGGAGGGFRRRVIRYVLTAAVAAAACAWVALGSGGTGGPGTEGRVTLGVFAVATVLWVSGAADDTFVALAAGLVLVTAGALEAEVLFGGLGDPTIWLLICAFVLAAGVTRTGLALRAAAYFVAGARTVRQLAHLVTAALVASAFAIPATSGRAALALPVFVALAGALRGRRRVVLALALIFPAVILLSAVATLIGAGAHLVTAATLARATGEEIGFVRWLLLGTPLAIVSSHLATEAVLLATTTREDRRRPVSLSAAEVGASAGAAVTGRLTHHQARAAALLAVVVALWCAEPLHGVPPAVVALIGAVVACSPWLGTVRLGEALKTVPWSMLLFMAATTAMGVALTTSGAAAWLAGGLLGGLSGGAGTGPPAWLFLGAVVVVSTLAHLVLQSRSARSGVLVPLVIAAAAGAGISPAAAAFASTAAAGFCLTLPSSAKPVALFHKVEGVTTYTRRDLLRVSAILGPLTAALVLAFALYVWPLLGLATR